MFKAYKLAAFVLLLAVCAVLNGCYTRLTTPKEAREYRTTYPELDQGLPIELTNARDNLGSTFIMTAEVYLDGIRRYARATGVGGMLNEPYRFRSGAQIEIKLLGHPGNQIDGTYRISKEGTVDIGPVADFPVAGRTKRQVRVALQQELGRFYKGTTDPNALPDLQVNVPSSVNRILGDATDLGSVSVFSAAVPTGSATNAYGTGGNSASGSAGGGRINLDGNDTLLHVLSANSVYSSFADWHEVVVLRRVTTQRVHSESGLPFQYWILIVCDLEKILYEDPNQNIELRDGDIIYIHAEKSPLIVELFRTALIIADVYDAFNGVEFVVEDLFKRDF